MSMRNWKDFAEVSAPKDGEDAKTRLTANLQYYSVNYAVIIGVVAVLCIVLKNTSLGVGIAIGLALVVFHAVLKVPSVTAIATNAGNDMRDNLKAKMNGAKTSMNRKSKKAE
eukprot:CFRG1073T1